MSVEGELLKFVASELLRDPPAVPLQAEDDLLGSGLVDSLGVVRIVTFLEKQYGVTVPPEDVRIEHFLTVRQIASYLDSRRSGDERDG